jgi:hypothetical protein
MIGCTGVIGCTVVVDWVEREGDVCDVCDDCFCDAVASVSVRVGWDECDFDFGERPLDTEPLRPFSSAGLSSLF